MSNNTNPTPHRWAEVIKAWAEGKTIQCRSVDMIGSKWADSDPSNDTMYGPWHNRKDLEWRIKPEVKTGWITIHNYGGESYAGNTIYESQQLANKTTAHTGVIACIPITYTPGEGL